MTSLDTIAKAERWYEKLSQAYEEKNQIEIEDTLSTLLITIRSIPDHLLEDFNQKFSLDISLEVWQFKQEFTKRSTGKSKEFIIWFDDMLKKIRSNLTCSVLMDKRNIDIHRQIQKPDYVQLSVKETMISSDSWSMMSFPAGIGEKEALRISREKQDARLKVIEEKRKTLKQNSNQFTIDYYFQDLPDTDILEASRLFLDAMKSVVKLANEKF